MESIGKLKMGKSLGPDNISSEIIKASGQILAPIPLKIFNHILTYGEYPKQWAIGLITPLHKKGSPFLTDNSR